MIATLNEPVVKKPYDPGYEVIDDRVTGSPGLGLGPEQRTPGLFERVREFVSPRALVVREGDAYRLDRNVLEYHVSKAIEGSEELRNRYQGSNEEQRAEMRNGVGRFILSEYADRAGLRLRDDGALEGRLGTTPAGLMDYANKGMALAGLGVLAASVATGGVGGIAAYLGILSARLAGKLLYRVRYGSDDAVQAVGDIGTPVVSWYAPGVGEVCDLLKSYKNELVNKARTQAVHRYLDSVRQPQREPLEVSEHRVGQEINKLGLETRMQQQQR